MFTKSVNQFEELNPLSRLFLKQKKGLLQFSCQSRVKYSLAPFNILPYFEMIHYFQVYNYSTTTIVLSRDLIFILDHKRSIALKISSFHMLLGNSFKTNNFGFRVLKHVKYDFRSHLSFTIQG